MKKKRLYYTGKTLRKKIPSWLRSIRSAGKKGKRRLKVSLA